MSYNIMDFAQESNVSRETLSDYQNWHGLLLKWNRHINLVSPTTLDNFWRRHALDSWQLWPYIPKTAENIIDLGSGAGFPGISMAIGCKTRGRGDVLMVESAGKKTSFLRNVIRDLNLPAKVTSERAEKLESKTYNVVTARAFAPLPRLLSYSQLFWGEETIGLFLKGEAVQEELTEAEKTWRYNVEVLPSRSDVMGCILKITGLKPR